MNDLKILEHNLQISKPISMKELEKDELKSLKYGLSLLNKENIINREPTEVKSFQENYIFEGDSIQNKVFQTNNFLKYGTNLRINVIKTLLVDTDRESVLVRIVHLKETEKGNVKQIFLVRDGTLVSEIEKETDESEVVIPTLEEYIPQTGDEVKIQAEACWSNGCCSFRYNGNPFNPLVKYKWCGAGCGGGTPVNALDSCCKDHDKCYGANKTYPNRCVCDKLLINCASNTDNAGSTRVVIAFEAKMVASNCYV